MTWFCLLGLNPPKFGKLFLLEEKGELVFKPTLTKKIQLKKASATQDAEGGSVRAFDLTGKIISFALKIANKKLTNFNI